MNRLIDKCTDSSTPKINENAKSKPRRSFSKKRDELLLALVKFKSYKSSSFTVDR